MSWSREKGTSLEQGHSRAPQGRETVQGQAPSSAAWRDRLTCLSLFWVQHPALSCWDCSQPWQGKIWPSVDGECSDPRCSVQASASGAGPGSSVVSWPDLQCSVLHQSLLGPGPRGLEEKLQVSTAGLTALPAQGPQWCRCRSLCNAKPSLRQMCWLWPGSQQCSHPALCRPCQRWPRSQGSAVLRAMLAMPALMPPAQRQAPVPSWQGPRSRWHCRCRSRSRSQGGAAPCRSYSRSRAESHASALLPSLRSGGALRCPAARAASRCPVPPDGGGGPGAGPAGRGRPAGDVRLMLSVRRAVHCGRIPPPAAAPRGRMRSGPARPTAAAAARRAGGTAPDEPH